MSEDKSSSADELITKWLPRLESIPLLQSLDRAELIDFAKHMKGKKYSEGKYLMKEGDIGQEFFVITKGTCEVLKANEGKVAILTKGDYCGEQALLTKCVRNASIKAVTDVECLMLRHHAFIKILGTRNIFKKRTAKRVAIVTSEEEPMKPVSRDSQIKSGAVVNWLLKCVSGNVLFEDLDESQSRVIVASMYVEKVKPKDVIIKQGDLGDAFYVIESGSFDVIVDGKSVAVLGPDKCFGELALLYDAPRNATVVALEKATVWVVRRPMFRMAIKQMYVEQSARYEEILQKIDLFKNMTEERLRKIGDVAIRRIYPPKTDIVVAGQKGDVFYVIMDGTAIWKKPNGETGPITHDYFGELALMSEESVRFATVTSETTLVTLELSRKDFTQLLGESEVVLKNKAKIYLTKHSPAKREICELSEFKELGVLGRGAFGYVTLVEDPKSKHVYALKAVRKEMIVDRHQENLILREKLVLQKLCHKRLIRLYDTYKDEYRVFFLLDACLGGELFTLLRRCRYFKEKVARFYSACVIEGFEYMHTRDIVYRDLKPENLILNTDGYLKITDFGFAKVIRGKTFTLCGTPDYIAPEILTGRGHDKGVDWWTLGVFIYEMLSSISPFFDTEPLVMYRRIVKGKYKTPRFFSQDATDIIQSLLCRRPAKRLGVAEGGVQNIKKHPWFKEFDWKIMSQNRYKAPFYPKVASKRDFSNFKQVKDKHGKLVACKIKIEDKF